MLKFNDFILVAENAFHNYLVPGNCTLTNDDKRIYLEVELEEPIKTVQELLSIRICGLEFEFNTIKIANNKMLFDLTNLNGTDYNIKLNSTKH